MTPVISETVARELLDVVQEESHAVHSVPPLRFATHRLKGFVGVCEYSCGAKASEESRRLLHLLADFAFLAGVGLKRTMGMLPPHEVVQLARHFGVSRIAALYRLRSLRLLTDAEFDRLKGLDEARKDKLLAERMGLPESDHADARNWFREHASTFFQRLSSDIHIGGCAGGHVRQRADPDKHPVLVRRIPLVGRLRQPIVR